MGKVTPLNRIKKGKKMDDVVEVAPVEEVVEESKTVEAVEEVEKVDEKPQEKEEKVKEDDEKNTVAYWKTHSRRNEDRAKDLTKKLDEVEKSKTEKESNFEALKNELDSLKKGIVMNSIQAEFGLNENQMTFLKGDTDEELKDSARALVAAFGGESKEEKTVIKTPKFIQGVISHPDTVLSPEQKSYQQFKNSSNL